MTEQMILIKAIEVAGTNGYKTPGKDREEKEEYAIMFSHDFARAFWSSDIPLLYKTERAGNKLEKYIYDWEFHLQQMVLEKDPIKYIAKFLK